MKFTILYDNYSTDENLKSAWGFSCLIEVNDKTILMDTGGDPEILQYNMKIMNIDQTKIDAIFITHEHWDHTGGLFSVLDINPDVTVYLLPSYSDTFVNKVKSIAREVVLVDEPLEIYPGVFSTGEMGTNIKEHSLVFDYDLGAIIVTGCSHQGIINIIDKAKEMMNDKIYLAFGGFHLYKHLLKDARIVVNEFKKSGVIKCGATHCTGNEPIRMLKDLYNNDYIEMGSGKILTFSKDG